VGTEKLPVGEPAPFPKANHQARETQEQRGVRECDKSLREIGVSWRLETRDGRHCVRFEVRNPRMAAVDGISGYCNVKDGDVSGALRELLKIIQSFKSHG
jgi:hypothetical protein